MDDHEDQTERFKQLPEPIRLSQMTTAHAAVPGSAVIFFGAPMPFGDGGIPDGDGN